MITIERITTAIRNAQISKEEKEAWVNLVPHLTEGELEELVASFENETQELASLRVNYLTKVQAVVDSAAAEEARKGIV